MRKPIIINADNKNVVDYNQLYLFQYREAIRQGEIVAGQELIIELDRLINDLLMDDDFYYDTTDADVRIDFMENCIRLTKSPFYGKPMILMLWQKAFIEVIYSFKMRDDNSDRFQRIILLIARKNTKALSLDTRIPTPTGDKTMRDILPGDFVFNECGKPVEVLGVSEIFENRKCYKVTFEDGEEIIADENHKWTVQTKVSRRVMTYKPNTSRKRQSFNSIDLFGCKTVTTAEMLTDFMHIRNDKKGCEYKYRVPVADALEYPEKDLYNPYVLGLWLGDGDKNDNRITCSKDDLTELCELITKTGEVIQNVKEWDGKFEVRIGEYGSHRNSVKDALRKLGVLKNKHIPEEYFTTSIKQRQALLQGLMDTDGCVSKAGECTFVQKSEVITRGVSKLLSSLGIKHSVIKMPVKCNGKPCGEAFRITFYVDKEHSCFRFERKKKRLKDELQSRMRYKSIINIEEVENRATKCITVDSDRGLFICGERNTVTHNSETSSALLLTEMIIGGSGLDLVCSSNDDNQADILYQACDTMRLMIDPESVDTWRNQKWIKCLINNNKIFKLSDRTKNKEGRNIDKAVIDEVHEMKDNVIIKSIEQSQSLKENPKLIIITTEGFVNGGFLDEELERDRAIINGEITDIASKRVTAWLYTQDSETEIWLGNRENRLWMKSNPTLGIVKKWTYLEQQVDIAKTSKTDRAFVLSKDFNVKQSNGEAWLMLEDYDYEATFDLNDFKNALCIGGVDIARTTDLACAKILLMKPNDTKKYIHTMYFIPEGKLERSDDKSAGAKYLEWANKGMMRILPGNYLITSKIADWFFELYEEYGLRPYVIGYDSKFADEFINKAEAYGFDTIPIWQRPEILSDPNNMVEADLISRQIVGLNEIDKWCLGNCALQVDNKGNGLVVKIDGQESRKIDGAVALIIAYATFKKEMSNFLDNL